MATIKQIFNAPVRGPRAQAAVLPGEDQNAFDQLYADLMSAWKPQDAMEKLLVEQIAVYQWKRARLEAAKARLYEPGALGPAEFALALRRLCLTQGRLERAVSHTISDLERYRKIRMARGEEQRIQRNRRLRTGSPTSTREGKLHYRVPPAPVH